MRVTLRFLPVGGGNFWKPGIGVRRLVHLGDFKALRQRQSLAVDFLAADDEDFFSVRCQCQRALNRGGEFGAGGAVICLPADDQIASAGQGAKTRWQRFPGLTSHQYGVAVRQ